MALLAINTQHSPESYYTHFVLGELNTLAGDRQAAIASFERAFDSSAA